MKSMIFRVEVDWFSTKYANSIAVFGSNHKGFLFGFNLWGLVVRVAQLNHPYRVYKGRSR